MNIVLITRAGNGLARKLEDLTVTRAFGISEVRTKAGRLDAAETVIIYDGQIGELQSHEIKQLTSHGAVIVWQPTQNVTQELVYYERGVCLYCFGETNHMLMQHCIRIAQSVRTVIMASEEDQNGIHELTFWLRMDTNRLEATIGNKAVVLTPIEFKLLYAAFQKTWSHKVSHPTG